MIRQYRTENDEAQRIEHGLDEPQQFSDGPREALARELANAWRPDHRPLTLREEIDERERGPRGQLAHDLRDAHRSDSAVHNRIADAMDAAGLAPRALGSRGR